MRKRACEIVPAEAGAVTFDKQMELPMSVMVIIRFPIPASAIAEWAPQNMHLLDPIMKLMKKHGRISHRAAGSDDAFLDFDEWPSREAYAAFKAEAGPLIETFEASFGHRSVDEVYDLFE